MKVLVIAQGNRWHLPALPTTLARLVLRTQARRKEKGPIPSSSPHPPLQRLRRGIWLIRVFVRAGVEWSGVGTLAVALGWGWGC